MSEKRAPVLITYNGRPGYVVVGIDHYKQLTKRGDESTTPG